MGRLIHTNDLHNAVMMNKQDWGIFAVTIDNLIEGVVSQVPTVEAIPKDRYEARLKADMVAMLTDIQLEIGESIVENEEYRNSHVQNGIRLGKHLSEAIIQEKINALKENKDE